MTEQFNTHTCRTEDELSILCLGDKTFNFKLIETTQNIRYELSPTKISNLHVTVRIQEKVLRLEISVHNHVPVTVINTRDYLLKKPSCL